MQLWRCHIWRTYSYLKKQLMNNVMIRLHQMQAFNFFFHCIFSFFISKSKNCFILPRQSTSFSQNCTFLLSKFRLTWFVKDNLISFLINHWTNKKQLIAHFSMFAYSPKIRISIKIYDRTIKRIARNWHFRHTSKESGKPV